MQMKSLHVIGLLAVAVSASHGQTQPVYWSTTKPNCTSLGQTTPIEITNSSGATLGYSCSVSGTFAWIAAGGIWSTTLRVSAPALNDIDADFTFYDKDGNVSADLDTTLNNDDMTLARGNEVEVPLFANQPLEVEVLGNTRDAPTYSNTAEGSVFAQFFCPDAATCNNVLPQLLYSALPTQPWSLSVPLAFDNALSAQWSAVAIDDGVKNVVGLVIYNEDTVAKSFTVNVYDSNGNLAGTGETPTIPPLQTGTGGSGEGGTYATLLGDLVSNVPAGPIKILVDGGTALSAVVVLQIDGSSATTLQVGFDSAPGAASTTTKIPRSSIRTLHIPVTRKVATCSLMK